MVVEWALLITQRLHLSIHFQFIQLNWIELFFLSTCIHRSLCLTENKLFPNTTLLMYMHTVTVAGMVLYSITLDRLTYHHLHQTYTTSSTSITSLGAMVNICCPHLSLFLSLLFPPFPSPYMHMLPSLTNTHTQYILMPMQSRYSFWWWSTTGMLSW